MEVPAPLKSLKPYINLCNQFMKRDPVLSYYLKMYMVSEGLKLNDPSSKSFLLAELGALESLKSDLSGEDAISSELVGQAHVENTAMKLFQVADKLDREAKFDKPVIKSFLTSSQLFTILKQFGELSEEVEEKMKYAKWKAVEISRCLKAGITPTPGPPGGNGEDGDDDGAVGFTYNHPGALDKPVPKPRHNLPPAAPPPPNTADGYSYPSLDSYSGPPNSTYPPGLLSSVNPPEPSSGVSPSSSSASIDPEIIAKAKKHCKFAASSLDYDDVAEAIESLEKALALLKH